MQIKKEIIWNSVDIKPVVNRSYLLSVQELYNGILQSPRTVIAHRLDDGWSVAGNCIVIAWAELPALEHNSAFVLGK